MTINMTPKQKKITAISTAGVVVIAGAVTAFVFFHKPKPPMVKAENAPTVAKFIGSENFASLDKTQKKEYLNQVTQNPDIQEALWSQRDNLSDAERTAMRNNMREVREQQMQERMDKYFSLKTPKEKKKMLDEVLADMQKRPQGRPRTDRPRGNPPAAAASNNSRGNSRTARREMASPQARAQRRQFMNDLRARAKELGLPMPTRRGR